MKRKPSPFCPFPLILGAYLSVSHADVFINEIRIDNGGTNDIEYFELYNDGPASIDLSGYTYVVIGDSSAGDGGIDDIVDLTGLSIPAGGWIVVADTGSGSLTGVDSNGDTVVEIAVTPDATDSLNFENGDNVTHILVQGWSGSSASDIDTDDNGVVDTTPWTTIVDAVGLIETPTMPPSGTEYAYGAALGFVDVGPDGSFVPNHVYRVGDGGPWAVGVRGTDGGSGVVSADGVDLLDTPGQSNPSSNGQLGLSLDINSISEDGSSFITGTVTPLVPPTSDLTVTVTLSDGTEAITADATIFASDPSGDFIIDAVDDFWADGDQTVTVTVSAPNYESNDATFTVTDDDTGFLVIINEVYNDISGISFDANNDGSADSDDEFIEVLNVSGTTLDLSGATLSDSSFVRHIFPDGTILDPGCAVLVFAGGDVQQGSVQFEFGDTPVQIALSDPQFPGLSLTDSGDSVILRDANGTLTGSFDAEVHSVDLPDQSGAASASSITTSTDGDASSGYILHTATIEGTEMSPGTTPAGGSYCSLTDTITVSIAPGTRTESDGFVAMAGAVSIPAALGSDLIVYIDSSDNGEIDLSSVSPLTILAGSTSADLDLVFVDDSEADGTQSVTLTARAIGYFNGTANIDVEDDGDAATFTDLVINEVDAQNPGTDSLEFVELFNKTGQAQSLDGLVLVLYNGNGDVSYNAIAFTPGAMIPANGYYVIGSGSVANVDQVEFTTNGLQNGADAVALYVGSVADFPNGTAIASVTNQLVDAVVYDDGGATDAELLATLTPGQPMATEGTNSNADNESTSRIPDGGAAFDSSLYQSSVPTPGAANTLPAGNDFNSWIAGFPGATNTGTEETNDGDGPNILDAFFGTDPTVTDNNALQQISSDGTSITFRHKLAKEALDDVVGSYEWSADLDTWNDDGGDNGAGTTVTFGAPAVVDGSNPDYDIVEVTATVSGTALPRVFVRINVDLLAIAF